MNEQEPDHRHYIHGLTGEQFQQEMIEQVDGDNWQTGRIHHFYSFLELNQTQYPDETVVISIKSNPTVN